LKFQIINHGTLTGFIPVDDAAQAWWKENVQWDEYSLIWGDQYMVESRYAGPILEGIQAASNEQQATSGGRVGPQATSL
jgi:hypothetical protein